jgi:hypothetical protein
MLDGANTFHPNIKLVRQVGTKMPFLDVFIENNNGILATSVYRKDSAEPYIVPFKSDHPRHIFNNIIDGTLTRALLYSSTLFAFNEEQRLIELLLLYNGLVFPVSCANSFSSFFYPRRYPPRHIYKHFKKFFSSTSCPQHRSCLALQLKIILHLFAPMY